MESDLNHIGAFFKKFQTAKIVVIVETDCDNNGQFICHGTQAYSLSQVRTQSIYSKSTKMPVDHHEMCSGRHPQVP
jgi:hypothetical protein